MDSSLREDMSGGPESLCDHAKHEWLPRGARVSCRVMILVMAVPMSERIGLGVSSSLRGFKVCSLVEHGSGRDLARNAFPA